MKTLLSRRAVLIRAVQLPVGGSLLAALASCGGESADRLVCADPSSLSSAQESVRRSLNYTERSADPERACAACEFFAAPAAGGGCGSCAIFDGGPVNPAGHCDSWSVDA